MTEQFAPISETGLGYDVFAPLWGILELGAVTASGEQVLRDVSLAGFVAAHRDELDRLLEVVRDVGDFSAETMAIFERQGGWNDNREVTAEYLMMYSGCIEGYPPPPMTLSYCGAWFTWAMIFNWPLSCMLW